LASVEKKKELLVVADLVKGVMAAGLAYLGYAAGGLLLVVIMNANSGATGAGLFEIKATDASLKTQFMLVLFLINKPMAVFWIARKWQANQIALWVIFLLFWFIDASALWAYQMIVLRSASIPIILFLGFFSAVIIATSLQRNYRKSAIE
jgi:uncharacterized membrane protein YoaK (UPF0700 family)